MMEWSLLALAASYAASNPALEVERRHHSIPCWTGAQMVDQAEPTAFTLFSAPAEGEEQPRRIEHRRILVMEGVREAQDRAELNYWFDNGGRPLSARSPLSDLGSVEIWVSSGERPKSVNEGRGLITGGVLCYLQRRFREITMLTDQGYVQVWATD